MQQTLDLLYGDDHSNSKDSLLLVFSSLSADVPGSQ
jgi:hypothetical protein